jgi:cytochrome c biogenesis protein
VIRTLANLRLAIGELAAIAALSAVGTVIEQNKPHAFYVANYPDDGPRVLGFVTYRLIEALQLDHLYSSHAFQALLGLLAASLAACTATTQWPAAQVAQAWRYKRSTDALAVLPVAALLPDALLSDLARQLAGRGFQVFLEGGRMYAFRGLVGRLAPIGVHASMLGVLAGVTLGAVGGYTGTLMVAEGEQAVVGSALVGRSPAARPPPGAATTLAVDKFTIDFRPDGTVHQFYSDVRLDGAGGGDSIAHRLYVNKPLRFGGVTAYQTDWGLSALRVTAAPRNATSPLETPPHARCVTLPLVAVGKKTWGTFLPLEAPPAGGGRARGISMVAEDPQAVRVYDSAGALAGIQRPGSGRALEVEGMRVEVEGVVASTGLELKSDPGVPLVYAGFGGMCVTTVLSCLSH